MVPGPSASTSLTPVTIQMPSSCAAAAMRRSAGEPTATDSCARRANVSFAPGVSQPANAFAQVDEG